MRTPAPTGLCHRTWFVKTGVGAHHMPLSFPGAVGVGRTGGHRPPLHTVYQHHRQARRHLLHRASDSTSKLWGQVGRGEAERQRMFTAGIETEGTLSGYLLLCENYRRRVGGARGG